MTSLSTNQCETIIGLILGDGCVKKSGNLILTNTNLRFLKHIQIKFKNFNSSVNQRKYRNPEGEWAKYKYRTAYDLKFCKMDFTEELRNLFYRDGIYGKIFPILQLTDTMLRYWYVCDGSINHKDNENRRSVVSIACTNEGRDNIYFNRLGLTPHLGKNQIGFGVNGTAKLFKEIGYDPVPGFEYKWPRIKLLTDDEMSKIASERMKELRKNLTLKEIGEHLDIDYHTVMNWEKGYTIPEYGKFKSIIDNADDQ